MGRAGQVNEVNDLVASGRCSRLDGVYDFEAKGCFSRFGRVEVLKPMSFLWAGQVAEGRRGQGKAGQGRAGQRGQ